MPLAARNAWNNAQKLAQKKNWKAAERELRVAVQVAPKFTRGWYALGVACSNQNKPAEARDAFQHVVELDPKSLDAYLPWLARVSRRRTGDTAEKTAAALIKAGHQAALSGDLPAPGDGALLPEGSGWSGEQCADRHSPGSETRGSPD